MVTKSYIKFQDTDLVGGQGLGVPEQGQDRGSSAGCCGVGVGAVGWSQSGGSAAGDCGAVAGRVGATEAGDTTQMLEQPPALVELRLAALRAGDGLRCHPASAETLTSLGSPRAGSPTHGAVGVTAVGWSWGVSTPPVPDQAVPKAPGGGSQDWVRAAWGQRGRVGLCHAAAALPRAWLCCPLPWVTPRATRVPRASSTRRRRGAGAMVPALPGPLCEQRSCPAHAAMAVPPLHSAASGTCPAGSPCAGCTSRRGWRSSTSTACSWSPCTR